MIFRVLLVTITGFMLLLSCKKTGHYELSRFIPPSTCGGCHSEIYNQWRGSMHRLAHKDPLYREVAMRDLKVLTDPDEIKEGELCVKCHTPVGYVTGLPARTSEHVKKIPEIAQEGVQCDFCHSATGAGKIYNADIKLDPGHGEEKPGTKRGPFKDSRTDFHESAYSKFHASAEMCGTCHDVRHVVFGTRLETPYEEWMKSPYAEKGIPCQGCHMYQRPGIPATGSTKRPENPGRAAPDGPERKHIFTHYFVGSNTLVPPQFGDPVQKRMAEARLKNAATITIGEKLSDGSVKITVKNTGAGHSIPTGLTHVRQVWIEVRAVAPDGKILLHSGGLDASGYLDKQAVLFNTVFGDGKGGVVMNVSKAREVLVNKRIEPMKSVQAFYRLSAGGHKAVTIEAKLWHRLVSQELADEVTGKGKLKIPAVLMASDKKVVKL